MRISYRPSKGVSRTSLTSTPGNLASKRSWICSGVAIVTAVTSCLTASCAASGCGAEGCVSSAQAGPAPMSKAAPAAARLFQYMRLTPCVTRLRFLLPAGGARDEKLLEQRRAVDQRHARVARPYDRRRLYGKQAMQPIGRQPHGQQRLGPPAPIAAQHGQVADAAENLFLRQHLDQRLDVAQPKIQPLPRQRMHAVRGIADQGHARRNHIAV